MGLIVVNQLQQYLAEQGIGQLPEADPSPAIPSIWLLPRLGSPAPRVENSEWLETQTITLNDTNLMGPPGLEDWLEDAFVSVLIRSQNAAEGKLLHRTIRGVLSPVGERAGKKNWSMAGLRVLYSRIWRQESQLPLTDSGITYDRVAAYRFTCARSDLA